jgi:hypothetical protein
MNFLINTYLVFIPLNYLIGLEELIYFWLPESTKYHFVETSGLVEQSVCVYEVM